MSCPIFSTVDEATIIIKAEVETANVASYLTGAVYPVVTIIRRVLSCRCGQVLQIRPPCSQLRFALWEKLNADLRALARLHIEVDREREPDYVAW